MERSTITGVTIDRRGRRRRPGVRSPAVADLPALRAEYPVLAAKAYLNAGTQGPIPRRAVAAAQRELEAELRDGRGTHRSFLAIGGLMERLRATVAELLGCGEDEVALTRSTTDGINTVLGALDLGPGGEVLTSDEEHPGLLAPLAAARARRGFDVRTVPFGRLVEAVEAGTSLVACSHVSWVSGRVVDGAALAAAARQAGALVLLDGAQGLGAVPVDVRALACDFYAAAGQKWLCGPGGIGYLYANPELVPELPAPWSGYHSMEDSERALVPALQPDARRLTTGFPVPHHVEWSHASLDVLNEAGFESVLDRGVAGAARVAGMLSDRGVEVAPRGDSTLVSFEVPDPQAFTERAAAEGIVVRGIPGRSYARASVGAWNTDDEL